MPLALDASTPAKTTLGASVMNGVSPSFSPPAGSVIHMTLACEGDVGTQTVSSVTNTGTALTWALLKRDNTAGVSSGSGTAEVWWAYNASAQSGITVTANLSTNTNGTGSDGILQVLVFTGAKTSQTGAAATSRANATAATPSLAVTTTADNSWVWCVVGDFTNGTAPTAGTAQTVQSNVSVTHSYWVQKQNATTTPAGSVTMNDTAPTSVVHDMVSFEVLAAPASGPTTAPPIPPGLQSPMAWRQTFPPPLAVFDLPLFAGTATQPATANIAPTPTPPLVSIPPGFVSPLAWQPYIDIATDFEFTNTFTQAATARIQITDTSAQTATANVAPTPFATTPPVPPGLISPQSFRLPGLFVPSTTAILASTQSASARIQTTGTSTQTATARIQVAGTSTQTAVARIQVTGVATQPTTANIAPTPTPPLVSIPPGYVSPISFQPFVDIPTDFEFTGTASQTTTARIQVTGTSTQLSVANIGLAPAYLFAWPPGLVAPQSFRQPFPTLFSTAVGQSTSTQPATARITNTATNVQTATARIQVIGSSAQTAIANIAVTPFVQAPPIPPGLISPQSFRLPWLQITPTTVISPSSLQPAVARIQQVGLTNTQTATARIQVTGTSTQTAVARIQTTGTSTQSSTANIVGFQTEPLAVAVPPGLIAPVSFRAVQVPLPFVPPGALTNNQPAIARIQTTSTSTQGAIARVRITGMSTQGATARIRTTGTSTQSAIARVQTTSTFSQTGVANLVASPTAVLTQPRPPGFIAPPSFLASRVPVALPGSPFQQAVQTATARILPAAQQFSTARILNTAVTKQQTAKARIRVDAPRICHGPTGVDRHRTAASGIDRRRTTGTATARVCPPPPTPVDRRRTGPAPTPRSCPPR